MDTWQHIVVILLSQIHDSNEKATYKVFDTTEIIKLFDTISIYVYSGR